MIEAVADAGQEGCVAEDLWVVIEGERRMGVWVGAGLTFTPEDAIEDD